MVNNIGILLPLIIWEKYFGKRIFGPTLFDVKRIQGSKWLKTTDGFRGSSVDRLTTFPDKRIWYHIFLFLHYGLKMRVITTNSSLYIQKKLIN